MTKRTVTGIKFTGAAAFSRVLAAFNRGPIKVQRDHAKRAFQARHISLELHGDQLVFHLVMWEGIERLLDGYTRVERIVRKLTRAPESVVLIIHEQPASLRELECLYDQFNSVASLKRASDRYDEGLRLSEMLGDIRSNLVGRAPRSAAQWATGQETVRAGVVAAKDSICFVDRLELDKTHETVGYMAVYYAVGRYAPHCAEAAETFIRILNRRVFAPKRPTAQELQVIRFREFYFDKVLAKSVSGKANVKAVLEKGMLAFVQYLGYESFIPKGAQQLTLAQFTEVMARALK